MDKLPQNAKIVNRSPNKRSLIRILYVYPIGFFLIGLFAIFLFYAINQYVNYQAQVRTLKSDFPRKQKEELKYKILNAKDYIFWVRSHPEEHILEFFNKKANRVEVLLKNAEKTSGYSRGIVSLALMDSLDAMNKEPFCKIMLIGSNQRIIYQDRSANKELGSGNDDNVVSVNVVEHAMADSILAEVGGSNPKGVSFVRLLRSSNTDGIQIVADYYPVQKTDWLKETVLDSLIKIKYANNEYIFINTFDGYALMSKGQLQSPPTSIRNSTETNWKDIHDTQMKLAKSCDGGYMTYYWRNRPDVDRSEKTSYISGDHDWGWIIGTGYFTDDILPIIQQMKNDLRDDIVANALRFVVFLLVLSVIAYFTMRYTAQKAKENILMFMHFFKRAAQGMQIIDSEKLSFTEFDELAQAANHMIYERERIKSVLSSEKSRLHYMIEAVPDLIFFKDADGRFLGCNKAFENYINKKSEDIAGLYEYDLFDESVAAEFIKTDQEIVSSRKAHRSTNWVDYPNGQRCLYYTLKTPYFDSENNLLGIIGISRDITEMEESRQRLVLAKEKAEESDRLKTAFLANMSHEIRTPMNAIIGFSDLLAEDDLTQEEKIDFTSKIKSAGRALMSLINDIIDIAKIEAGQLQISESICDVNHLMNDLQGTFIELKNNTGKQDLNINLTVPKTPIQIVTITDPMRLQQVLTNLLSNALKFTETGSIEFGYSIQDDTLAFFVKDTGIGISPSKQALLFQRFSQVDASTTRKYGGTGLGLAISKNLVELLGGSIRMESDTGKGSTFYFSLPFKPANSVTSVKADAINLQSVNWKGKTILIAEDIVQNYMLMEALLKRTGVRLIHAVNGQLAVDIFKAEPNIDLVLMDIQLPIKTGYEALKEILELNAAMPVMSYTAFALPHEREKSIKAGFVDFIPKPIKTETLIPMLDKYLQNQG